MSDALNPRILSRQVLDTARKLLFSGIARGRSGNVSARCDGGFLITPSHLPIDACKTRDLVFVGMASQTRGDHNPSVEWLLHRDIYAARPDANAVVHSHPIFATSISCLGLDIPSFHHLVALFGGHDVRCSRYATFASAELSETVVEALEDRRACLVAHHGMVTLGASLDQALNLTVELEILCEQYCWTRLFGTANTLPLDEMARVRQKMALLGYMGDS